MAPLPSGRFLIGSDDPWVYPDEPYRRLRKAPGRDQAAYDSGAAAREGDEEHPDSDRIGGDQESEQPDTVAFVRVRPHR